MGYNASAVHARWRSPDGKIMCNALAVASEPEIFWNGGNAAGIIAGVKIPPEAGYLELPGEQFNGPSGRALDGLYLAPLGYSRSDAWLCDLVPHPFMNPEQSGAMKIPRSKLRGIFVGEEIYYTGGGHTSVTRMLTFMRTVVT